MNYGKGSDRRITDGGSTKAPEEHPLEKHVKDVKGALHDLLGLRLLLVPGTPLGDAATADIDAAEEHLTNLYRTLATEITNSSSKKPSRDF